MSSMAPFYVLRLVIYYTEADLQLLFFFRGTLRPSLTLKHEKDFAHHPEKLGRCSLGTFARWPAILF